MSSAPPPRFIPPVSATPAEPPPPAGPPRETNWQPWSGIVALPAAFFAAVLLQFVVLAVGSAFGSPFDDPTPAVNILSLLVQDFCFVGAAIFFARAAGPIVPAQFGLRRTRFVRAFGVTAGLFLGYIVFNALYATLIDANTETNDLPSGLGVHQSTVALVAVGLLVTVVAPLAEEFLFRGFMFGALRNWRGPWTAAVITGVVFGAIHVLGTDVEFLLPLMVFGFLLCLIRWRTDSLLPCIVLHAINNSIAFGDRGGDFSIGGTALWTVGAVAACMLICAPFVGSRSDQANAPAT
ncbi:type II CAAX endopeptidase family protein [Conexibacter sp. JD483]|uniref:CPBP family intramembrane glutamic endopeptidase n=1 Tax=unclassified Conexibacter TaxID=2627773 RepID=UPI0027180483|nr:MULTISPECIES: type II CAAX endopeptidase family protein [unclassified Conexibacter]MDO8184388.1 type II CAAX endopeptidase family protein [Conexibacter sp. CPCC 205706]MDO8197694.1 type II CAAX endopeptidase family protein [Conexibacter sp. CPCC 205762]MDR9368357.1 type II CAAX endopeptidase family protein [Conexibacter sp. JD483]